MTIKSFMCYKELPFCVPCIDLFIFHQALLHARCCIYYRIGTSNHLPCDAVALFLQFQASDRLPCCFHWKDLKK